MRNIEPSLIYVTKQDDLLCMFFPGPPGVRVQGGQRSGSGNGRPYQYSRMV